MYCFTTYTLTTKIYDDHFYNNIITLTNCYYDLINVPANVKDGKLLEFGCGPAIHNAFLGSWSFKEITMSDFAKPNRDAVNKWLRKDEGAFDWSHFLQFVADLEKSRLVDG